MKQFTTTLLLKKQKQRAQKVTPHGWTKGLAVVLLATFISCMAMQTSSAQAFQKGANVINLGIGIGTTLYGTGYNGTMPPVSISYEKGIENGKWGIGGYLARTGAKYGDSHDYWKFSYTIIGARGDYHFYTTDKLDTYGGVILGYDIFSDKYKGEGEGAMYKASGGGVVFSPFVGARYYFSDHIGGFAELGYGIAWLNIGLAFNLN